MSEVLSHTIAEAMKVTGLGRSSLYEAIGAGKIAAKKSGKRTLIPAESLRAFVANLPAADIGAAGRKAAACAGAQAKAACRVSTGRWRHERTAHRHRAAGPAGLARLSRKRTQQGRVHQRPWRIRNLRSC